MKTPVGDLFDKQASVISKIDIFGFKNGVLGLQKLSQKPSGSILGYYYGWFVENGNVFLIFYNTLNDLYNNTNPFYIRYGDYNKINFPTVATWNGSGIDFTAVSTYVENLVKKWEAESQSGIENTIKKYLPFFIGGLAAVIFLPSLINTLKREK
jgi:hypothetical protein